MILIWIALVLDQGKVCVMDYRYDKEIGKQIAKLRIQANLTQEDLSAQLQTKGCDLTRSAIAKIEAGQRHIYTCEIKAIKEVLKIAFDEGLIMHTKPSYVKIWNYIIFLNSCKVFSNFIVAA